MTKRRVNLTVSLPVPGLQGPRALPQSAAGCTRCNACSQSCPLYLLHPQETVSPRGRVQLIRLLTEGKLNITADDPTLQYISQSCLLCARCSSACAAQIPVAHHMLALRRAVGLKMIPTGLYLLMRLHNLYPGCFDKLLRSGLFLRRMGLAFLLKPLLPFWLRHAQAVLPRKTSLLSRLLYKQNIPLKPDTPQAVYLPSLYAQYIDTQAGLASYRLLADKKPAVLFGYASGLFEYMYGSRTRCLKTAKKLLCAWEKTTDTQTLPLITDSIEVYSFLKNYPLLFNTISGWKQRAEKLAEQVHFIAEYLQPVQITDQSVRVALDDSSVLFPATEQAQQVRKILLATYGENLLECAYSRFPLPPTGSMFVNGSEAAKLLQRQVQDITQAQVDKIYCLSPWAALELNRALRKKGLAAQARFIIYYGQ